MMLEKYLFLFLTNYKGKPLQRRVRRTAVFTELGFGLSVGVFLLPGAAPVREVGPPAPGGREGTGRGCGGDRVEEGA